MAIRITVMVSANQRSHFPNCMVTRSQRRACYDANTVHKMEHGHTIATALRLTIFEAVC